MASPELPRSATGDRNPWLIAVVVSIATFMEVLDTSIANVALRLNLDVSFRQLSFTRITQVIWLPFLFIPISAVSYVGVPADRSNDASVLYNLMRNLGGSVGVAFTTTMLQERTQFHHARLAEHITVYNGYGWSRPLAPVGALVQAQAAVMSYLDIFWVLGLLAFLIWPLVLLLPRVPKGTPAGH